MRLRPPRAASAAMAAIAFALLAACAGPQRPKLPPPEPLRYGGVQATFTSGLRLVALQFEGTHRATVVAAYASGSADDPPGKDGAA